MILWVACSEGTSNFDAFLTNLQSLTHAAQLTWATCTATEFLPRGLGKQTKNHVLMLTCMSSVRGKDWDTAGGLHLLHA